MEREAGGQYQDDSERIQSTLRATERCGEKRDTEEVQQTVYTWDTGDCQAKGTALATCLKRYTGEAEARRINRMFSTEPCKVYFQWQGNTRTDPLRLRLKSTGRAYRRRRHHITPVFIGSKSRPKQSPRTGASNYYNGKEECHESRAGQHRALTSALSPDMIHNYWLKKPTALD